MSPAREYVRDGKMTKMMVVEITDDRFVHGTLCFFSFCVFFLCSFCFFISAWCNILMFAWWIVLFSSGKVDCALFGDYVDELKSLMDRSGEGMPVLVIQFAKIKIFRGTCLSAMNLVFCFTCVSALAFFADRLCVLLDNASIQNVMAATRILVNPEIPEAVDFKNGLESVSPVFFSRFSCMVQ
jgi:hypothetical protein